MTMKRLISMTTSISKSELICFMIILLSVALLCTGCGRNEDNLIRSQDDIYSYLDANQKNVIELMEEMWNNQSACKNCGTAEYDGIYYICDYSLLESYIAQDELPFYRSLIDALHPCWIVIVDSEFHKANSPSCPCVVFMFDCINERGLPSMCGWAYIRPTITSNEFEYIHLFEQASYISSYLTGYAHKTTTKYLYKIY